MNVTLKKIDNSKSNSCCCKSNTINRNNENFKKIEITCTIIDSPYDLIIGRPTIQKHNLLCKLYDHLMDVNNNKKIEITITIKYKKE